MAKARDMARSARESFSDRQLGLGALLLGGIVAGLAFPRLLMFGRRAIRGIGGMTYRTVTPSGTSPAADPAKGRPA